MSRCIGKYCASGGGEVDGNSITDNAVATVLFAHKDVEKAAQRQSNLVGADDRPNAPPSISHIVCVARKLEFHVKQARIG